MNCHKIQEKFADFLAGDLDPESQAEIQNHISACSACRGELENLSAVWAKLGVLPLEQPNGSLRSRFYSMLEDYKDGLKHKGTSAERFRPFSGWKDWLFSRKPAFAFGFSFLLLFLGIGTGYLLNSGRGTGQIAALHQEVQDMRQVVAVSLLSQPSATERLLGIGYSSRLDRPDNKILAALFSTLASDPNVNVRLAAVDALYLFRNQPRVKENLVQSLSAQNSPLVQVALIDLLVEIREQRAAEALKKLIRDEKLNPEVKQRAEQGLQQLI